MPLLAAAGGMIVPAGIFALLVMAVDRPEAGTVGPCPCDRHRVLLMAARLNLSDEPSGDPHFSCCLRLQTMPSD